MGSLVSGSSAAAEAAAQAAERRAKIQQQQQEAIQRRELIKAGDREETLEKQKAATRRALIAKRSGRNSLAFTAPVKNLKTTLGE